MLTSLRYIILILLFLFFFSCQVPRRINAEKKNNNNDSIVEQRQLLKDFALCSCLRFGYGTDSAVYKDITVSIYYNQLLYADSSINKVEDFAKAYSRSIKTSEEYDYQNKKPILFSCLLFYKSKLLDSLVKTLDSTIMR